MSDTRIVYGSEARPLQTDSPPRVGEMYEQNGREIMVILGSVLPGIPVLVGTTSMEWLDDLRDAARSAREALEPHETPARSGYPPMGYTDVRVAQNDIMLRINQLSHGVQGQDETSIVCAREALRTISRVATRAMSDLDVAIAHLQQRQRDEETG